MSSAPARGVVVPLAARRGVSAAASACTDYSGLCICRAGRAVSSPTRCRLRASAALPSLPFRCPRVCKRAPVRRRCSSERAVGAAACPLPTIRSPRACRRPRLPHPSGWSALHEALMPALLDRLARWKPRASSVSVTLSPRRAPRRANPPREDLVCPCPSDRCETAAR